MALDSRRGRCCLLVSHQVTSQHPVTVYGFALALVTLVSMVVLLALGDVSSDVAVPVIVGIGGGSLGAAAGIAAPNSNVNESTGTVGYTDPSA